MNRNEKQIVMVDMDRTICDFDKRWYQVKENYPNVEYPQSQIGFFSRLEPIEGAIEGVKKLEEKYDIYFLTRPSIMNLHCYTEKAEWIRENFGIDYLKKLIIAYDKSMVKGDYLIDDHVLNGQLEFKGEFIKFDSERFPNWKEVLDYLM